MPMIWDTATSAFKESDTPMVWDENSQAYVNSEGMVWNSTDWAYDKAWPEEPPTWADGDAGQIARLVAKCYANNQSLADYGWQVGDTRTVHLAGNVNEDVVFVIEDLDNQTSGGTAYKAIVGQRNGLSTKRRMNPSNTNSGGYNSSEMKSFIEGDYQTALQNATTGNFWNAVKEATHRQQVYSSGLQTTVAKVILHSISDFAGPSYTYIDSETAAAGFHKLAWYENEGNLKKRAGEAPGSTGLTWSRSANTRFATNFFGTGGGDVTGTLLNASQANIVAPMCVL